jgi:excisionase family DNA binding protein
MISNNSKQNGINGMTTVAEAAKILDVSPRRVLQFIREKRLRAQQVNSRMYLLDIADVKEFRKQPRETGNPMFKKSKNTD